jgi:hypothetical protein
VPVTLNLCWVPSSTGIPLGRSIRRLLKYTRCRLK